MSRVKSWTDEEVGFLLDNEHMSARWIAEELGRGRQSVQKMRQKLREGGEPLAAWTEDEDDFILSNPTLNETQVAEHLSRTIHAVRTRRSALGRKHGVTFYGSKSPNHVGTRTLLAKTCPDCGLLLTPKWFGKRVDGFWRSACIRCQPPQDRKEYMKSRREDGEDQSSRDFYQKMQAFTKERATRNGEEWTEADHEILRDPEVTILTKALKLGRTYAAVSTQCSRNGYPSLVGHGDPIKGQWIIHNPNAAELVAA